MAEGTRGTTFVLAGVTLAALTVSFFSSVKARTGHYETAYLKEEVEKLNQTAKLLEENLHKAKERYDKEALTNRNLQQALLQEELKNEALTEELESARAETPKATQSSNVVPGRDH